MHFLAFFILVYVGVEVTIGGWIVTYIIEERHGGPSSGYISSGFFGGLTLGRVALLPINKWIGERRALYIYALLSLGYVYVFLPLCDIGPETDATVPQPRVCDLVCPVACRQRHYGILHWYAFGAHVSHCDEPSRTHSPIVDPDWCDWVDRWLWSSWECADSFHDGSHLRKAWYQESPPTVR